MNAYPNDGVSEEQELIHVGVQTCMLFDPWPI